MRLFSAVSYENIPHSQWKYVLHSSYGLVWYFHESCGTLCIRLKAIQYYTSGYQFWMKNTKCIGSVFCLHYGHIYLQMRHKRNNLPQTRRQVQASWRTISLCKTWWVNVKLTDMVKLSKISYLSGLTVVKPFFSSINWARTNSTLRI